MRSIPTKEFDRRTAREKILSVSPLCRNNDGCNTPQQVLEPATRPDLPQTWDPRRRNRRAHQGLQGWTSGKASSHSQRPLHGTAWCRRGISGRRARQIHQPVGENLRSQTPRETASSSDLLPWRRVLRRLPRMEMLPWVSDNPSFQGKLCDRLGKLPSCPWEPAPRGLWWWTQRALLGQEGWFRGVQRAQVVAEPVQLIECVHSGGQCWS